MYTLLEICWLNAVNPQEWLANVFNCIEQGHPVNRLDKLMPWPGVTAWDDTDLSERAITG
ncbi:transposase domain-containing protein [Sphingomonas sp. CFBP 8760]|uniref:transposase domain-containing protein n=1 Tax=Sphingomonas sp. CFBP 8760 TaxID=2775282 RepID=UPI00177C21FF|nr:transposase domain-containing protein [Sphingomonas sp. CFBP 8760]MBD8546924.1 transposase domain-containing protein [Sphingomonas sp. CFBP 8760]